MNKVLVDTNVYSYAFRGDVRAQRVFQRYPQILLSPIVIGELLLGFRRGARQDANRHQLMQFLAQDRVQELSITRATSSFFAEILADLRTKGRPIPTNDVWIAAQAMENGAALASDDHHFQAVSGLHLVPLPSLS